MPLDAPTFVVQRRVNHPLSLVQRGLADRAPITPQRLVDLGENGSMFVAEPLHPVAPFSSRQPMPTWCTRANLLTPRGRLVATVEVEVSMWAHDATSVSLRPVARHPERWRAWRMRRYFGLAHHAADATAHLLAPRATTPNDVRFAGEAPASCHFAHAAGASY